MAVAPVDLWVRSCRGTAIRCSERVSLAVAPVDLKVRSCCGTAILQALEQVADAGRQGPLSERREGWDFHFRWRHRTTVEWVCGRLRSLRVSGACRTVRVSSTSWAGGSPAKLDRRGTGCALDQSGHRHCRTVWDTGCTSDQSGHRFGRAVWVTDTCWLVRVIGLAGPCLSPAPPGPAGHQQSWTAGAPGAHWTGRVIGIAGPTGAPVARRTSRVTALGGPSGSPTHAGWCGSWA